VTSAAVCVHYEQPLAATVEAIAPVADLVAEDERFVIG
jgi:hypothetical protein